MPKGPKGEKRPADVIGAAVHVVAKIATGEIEDNSPVEARFPDYARKGGPAKVVAPRGLGCTDGRAASRRLPARRRRARWKKSKG